MRAKWTVLASVAVALAAFGVVVAFETAHSRTSAQREQFADRLWPIVGCLLVSLWAWHFAARRTRRP
jgi:hypothetical protein